MRTRRHVTSAAIALLVSVACSAPQHAQRDGLALFDEYRAEALAVPRCFSGVSPVPPSWPTVAILNGTGRLRLPGTFQRPPSRATGGAEAPPDDTWFAADSAELTVSLAPEPAAAMAAGPGTLLDRIEGGFGSQSGGPTCGLAVALAGDTAPALVFRWINGNPTDPDSVHGLVGHVLLRPGRVLNVMLLAPSRSTQDSVLLALTSLELSAAIR